MVVLAAALLCLPAVLAGPLRLQARQGASFSGPSVSIANGTVQGISIPGLGAEAFLGIPYAQPPTGQLRLARPVALNSTFSGGTFDATGFGPVCPGYGVSSYPNPAAGQNYVVDENCLNIQIVRPAGVNDTAGLPVLFWIFGGGFVQGAANDPRYNGTYLVQRSVENGKPIIFASVNYRLAAFGFPAGQAAASEGVLNLGLRDQRMALQWVQDNIAAFGGDPAKVTIWGQSAGGQSVISQTIAYGGRDDGLFRAAISDSGAFSTQNSSVASQAPAWNRLLNATGCSDDLACLRALPFETFYAAANGTYTPSVVVDGDFIQAPSWSLYTERKFVNTPLMLGNNLDEATSGIGAPVGVNNDTAFEAAIRGNIANLNLADRNATVQQILSTFTNDPSQGCPFNTGPGLLPTGLQDKRVNWFYTDALAAGVRYVAQQHSQLAPTFKYHFVQIPQNGTIDGGVAHFFEIPYVFGVMNQTVRSPMSQRPADLVTSRAMQDYWINFVNDLDPGTSSNGTSWPAYSSGGQVLTIENDNIRPEPDTFRNTSIGYIIDTVSSI